MSESHHPGPITGQPVSAAAECGWYGREEDGSGPRWCSRLPGHPDGHRPGISREMAGLTGTIKLGYVAPVSVDDVRLGPPSFDELLAAADDDELASAAVYGLTSSPELVRGLSFAQAAQINARISAHAAAVEGAAALLGAHLEQHRLDLLLRRHERLGLHLGYEVTPTTSHDCRLKLLWTPHDVHLVTYGAVAARRPGMPAWEVATDARFEAHPGRALSPAVIAAAAIAAVDEIEAS